MRSVSFLPRAFDDFVNWANVDPKTYSRIADLIRDIQRSPFLGLGKPEA